MFRLLICLLLLGGCTMISHNHQPLPERPEMFLPEGRQNIIIEPTVQKHADGHMTHYIQFDKALIETLQNSHLFGFVGRDAANPNYRIEAVYRREEKSEFGSVNLCAMTFFLVPMWKSYDIAVEAKLINLRNGAIIDLGSYRENVFVFIHLTAYPAIWVMPYETDRIAEIEKNIAQNISVRAAEAIYAKSFAGRLNK